MVEKCKEVQKSVKDFKCDLNCPALNNVFIDGLCCNNCYRTKKKYLTDENKHLWTEWDGKARPDVYTKAVLKARHNFKEGFYDPEKGCRLSREDMPIVCREYDCRKDQFYMCNFQYTRIVWNGKWVQLKPISAMARGVILKDHLNTLLDRIKRDIRRFCYGERDIK